MSFDPTFAAFYALRDRAAELQERYGQQLADFARIQAEPPHTDDMVERFCKGIDSVASDFEARVATRLSDPSADPTDIINEGGAIYFMRELATKKAPELVKRLFPKSGGGMKRADRVTALFTVEEALRRIRDELSELIQAFAIESAALRQARLDATYAGDGKMRSSIEGIERQLMEDVVVLRQTQELHAKRPAGKDQTVG